MATAAYPNKLARIRPSWGWFYILLALLASSIIAFVIFQPITVLPRITLAPGFNFVDQNGRFLSNETLRGNITLYSFSHANCDLDCPLSAGEITAVYQTLNRQLPASTNLQLVTLSLDPANDTPEQLQAITAGVANWHWLTGDPQRLRYAIGGGFDLYYAQRADGSIKFEPRYILVDSKGLIRAYYYNATPDSNILLRDINFLTEEQKNSTSSKRFAYEAAHLFACYPN